MIHTELNFFVFNICKCLSIYNASSLVGDNIKAYGIPFFSTLTTIGSKKHKVLPLPVFDAMIKSYRWLTPAGIAYRWIDVGFENPWDYNADRRLASEISLSHVSIFVL